MTRGVLQPVGATCGCTAVALLAMLALVMHASNVEAARNLNFFGPFKFVTVTYNKPTPAPAAAKVQVASGATKGVAMGGSVSGVSGGAVVASSRGTTVSGSSSM